MSYESQHQLQLSSKSSIDLFSGQAFSGNLKYFRRLYVKNPRWHRWDLLVCRNQVAHRMTLHLLSRSPDDSLPRRWLKELLYLEIDEGLGEPEAEDGKTGCSNPIFRPAEAGTVGGGIVRGSLKLEDVIVRLPLVRGEAPSGGSTSDGDADNGGALKGWIDIEGRLAIAPLLSPAMRPTGPTLAAEICFRGGDADEGEVLPISRTARNVDMGLAPVIGPTWWNVERLP